MYEKYKKDKDYFKNKKNLPPYMMVYKKIALHI